MLLTCQVHSIVPPLFLPSSHRLFSIQSYALGRRIETWIFEQLGCLKNWKKIWSMKCSTYFDHFHKVSWKSISIYYLLSLFKSAPYKWIQGSQGDEACKCFCLRLLHVCVAALVAALILVQQCWLTEENTYLHAPLVAFGSRTHAFLLYYPDYRTKR